MTFDKPSWWPENPYPKDIFPMPDQEYERIVPDPAVRTALSGMLGHRFWNIASAMILQAFCDSQENSEPEER